MCPIAIGHARREVVFEKRSRIAHRGLPAFTHPIASPIDQQAPITTKPINQRITKCFCRYWITPRSCRSGSESKKLIVLPPSLLLSAQTCLPRGRAPRSLRPPTRTFALSARAGVVYSGLDHRVNGVTLHFCRARAGKLYPSSGHPFRSRGVQQLRPHQ